MKPDENDLTVGLGVWGCWLFLVYCSHLKCWCRGRGGVVVENCGLDVTPGAPPPRRWCVVLVCGVYPNIVNHKLPPDSLPVRPGRRVGGVLDFVLVWFVFLCVGVCVLGGFWWWGLGVFCVGGCLVFFLLLLVDLGLFLVFFSFLWVCCLVSAFPRRFLSGGSSTETPRAGQRVPS